jgi:hypothetical protein
MPTRKEVSKLKQDWVQKRDAAIQSKINKLQEEIYNNLIPDFLAMAKLEEIRKQANKSNIAELNRLEAKIKKGMTNGFPEVMRETVKASRSLGDLNLMYFSTLMDSNRLDEIKTKSDKIINRRLGINEDGKILKDGFVDKTLRTDKVQREFISEVKRMISSNADTQALQGRLKTLILGSPERDGIIRRYYRTFATNILNNIDRSNNLVYANELDLDYGYYSGGLIQTSRSFCIDKNGKIFSRAQMEKWKDDPFIKKMYGKKINEYDPFTMVGGHGCLHVIDWVTNDLAKGRIREQNSRASERNKKFKERYGL